VVGNRIAGGERDAGVGGPQLIKRSGCTAIGNCAVHRAVSAVGGLIAGAFVSEGPNRTSAPPFRWSYAAAILQDRPGVAGEPRVSGAHVGAVRDWAWIASYLHSRYSRLRRLQRVPPGCVIAGKLADRIWPHHHHDCEHAISAVCAAAIGRLLSLGILRARAIAMVWDSRL